MTRAPARPAYAAADRLVGAPAPGGAGPGGRTAAGPADCPAGGPGRSGRLARDFADLVRTRQPERLEGWLARATTSEVSALRRFAQGLRDDYAAVKAGVTVPWSNGPVEGHINRLKMLKRQMFGRAHLDLLSRRFLRAPRAGQAQAPGQREPAPACAAPQDA